MNRFRSDHISVLLELDCCRTEGADVREERYCIHDVNWEEWVKISESKFLEFNKRVKKQLKVTGRRKRPPWYNEEVQKARHEVNILSRTYKRRKTPSNLEKLREKENEVDVIEENAKKK